MKKKILVISLLSIVIMSLVIAQITVNLPSTFTMNLNNLPPQQSPNQMFFDCPYGELEFRNVEAYRITNAGINQNIYAGIRYWTENRNCAGIVTMNFTVSPSLSSAQLVTNFENSVNNAFLIEALSDRQRRTTNLTIISTGSPSISGGSG